MSDIPPISDMSDGRVSQNGFDVAPILAAHDTKVGPVTDGWLCMCGAGSTNGSITTNDLTSREERHAERLAHLAAVVNAAVAEHVAGVRHAAWVEGSDSGWRNGRDFYRGGDS